MARVVAICQARLGSSRLPRKVLADLHGETVLARLMRNLGMCERLDAVCLAVPEGDGVLLDVVPDGQFGVAYPAPENDVLARYAGVAQFMEADVIVRITADCPLIDPALVDEAVRLYLNCRYAPGYYWRQGAPRGTGDIELFSRKALDKAQERETDADRREHVWRAVAMRGGVKVPWVPQEIRRPKYRVCIDTEDDLKAVQAILTALDKPAINDARQIIGLLDSRPDLVAINAHVEQAS